MQRGSACAAPAPQTGDGAQAPLKILKEPSQTGQAAQIIVASQVSCVPARGDMAQGRTKTPARWPQSSPPSFNLVSSECVEGSSGWHTDATLGARTGRGQLPVQGATASVFESTAACRCLFRLQLGHPATRPAHSPQRHCCRQHRQGHKVRASLPQPCTLLRWRKAPPSYTASFTLSIRIITGLWRLRCVAPSYSNCNPACWLCGASGLAANAATFGGPMCGSTAAPHTRNQNAFLKLLPFMLPA